MKIFFFIFYVLLVLAIFIPKSPIYHQNYIIKKPINLKKNSRNSYEKDIDNVKDSESKFYGVETGKLDILVLDIDYKTPFWKLYEMEYKQKLKNHPFVVRTMNGGLHFYFSYSKSRKNGLKMDNCHISCGGIIGLDVLIKNTFAIIPPTTLKTPEGLKSYRWLRKRLDFKDTTVLPSLSQEFIELLNYLGKPQLNFRFYRKYNGLNYHSIYKFRKQTEEKNILVVFWSGELKGYVKDRLKNMDEQHLTIGEKYLGSYFKIKNVILFCADFHFKLEQSKNFDKYVINLFEKFNVDIYFSIQTGGTRTRREMGAIRQSKEVYIYNDANVQNINYTMKNDYQFAPFAPIAFVDKFKDVPKEPYNGVITSDAAFSMFTCASSYRPKCEAYGLSIVTDYVGEKDFALVYKETRFIFGKFLDKFLFKILGITKYV